MSLTRAERTTTINYDEEGPLAEITTYSRSLINSLRKNESAQEVGSYPEGGVLFKVPKKLINVRNQRKPRRKMTEAERAAARDRLASARAAKGSGDA